MKEKVIEFRKALDQIIWSNMPSQFQNFPEGTCGDISDMLAEYLYSEGVQKIDYVYGYLGESSHAWLEVDSIAIDITADQFPEISEPVLFQPPEIWHTKYKDRIRRRAGYIDSNGFAISDINKVHLEVLRILNA